MDSNSIPDDERTIRELVAKTNRMLFMENQLEFSGHVSIRNPANDVVYINSFSTPRGAVTPEDVVEIDIEGNPLDPDETRPVGEREIHTAIYRHNPEYTAVLHTHPEYLTLFAIAGEPIVPVSQRGTVLSEGPVPRLERPGKIVDRDEGEQMVDAMSGKKQLLIRNHGAVITDTTIARALARAVFLERNAKWQYRATALGDLSPTASSDLERAYERGWTDSSIEKFWKFFEWKAIENGYLPRSW